MNSFILVFDMSNPFYAGQSSIITDGKKTERRIKISVRDLCWNICYVSKKYYEKNEDKFNFIEYNIEEKL